MPDLTPKLHRSGLLTREQAAERLGVSPATITRYLYDGRLDGLGPVVLVSRASVERYQRDSAGKVGRPAKAP